MLLFLIASQNSTRPLGEFTRQFLASRKVTAPAPSVTTAMPPLSSSNEPIIIRDETALRRAEEEIRTLRATLADLTATTEQRIARLERQLSEQSAQNRKAFVLQGMKGLISLGAFLKILSQPDPTTGVTTTPVKVDFKEQILFYDPETSQVLALDRDSTTLFQSYGLTELFRFSDNTETTITQALDFLALIILMANATKSKIKPAERSKYDAQGSYIPDFSKLQSLIRYMMTTTQPQSTKPKPPEVNINNVNPWKDYFTSITFTR